jgi:hypothetical protein
MTGGAETEKARGEAARFFALLLFCFAYCNAFFVLLFTLL